ncbi:hypothetical protein SAMN00017405_2019 [Desulfonispora thiosulfatigenes DSM 11270]|uniref:Uncharacterized protein n=1 Tax=Desulfonispora thiosulfatigenes DSM 11270 TaxID=656914 RepID=A0A1W1UIZ3_DESTI|nr:NusG domain II-containing protein [Desulfonispora thiosulfatigenes]SMB80983.1 hypothetical protein SAMN00017405_2019 [Desulfonispora thiosulfatigenes DSM 11270]
MKRGDKILIGILLLIVLAFFMLAEARKANEPANKIAVVRVKGEIEQKIELVEDRNNEFNFIGPMGISRARLENGKIKMISSPCKDKICIKQGHISTGGQSIVCVPNQVSISIEKEDELDEITR